MRESFILNPIIIIIILIMFLTIVLFKKANTNKTKLVIILASLILIIIINSIIIIRIFDYSDNSINHIIDSSEYQENKHNFRISQKEKSFKYVWENLYSEVKKYEKRVENLDNIEGLLFEKLLFYIDIKNEQVFEVNYYNIDSGYKSTEISIHGKTSNIEFSITDNNISDDANYRMTTNDVMYLLDETDISRFISEFYKNYNKKDIVVIVTTNRYHNKVVSTNANRTYLISGNYISEKQQPFRLDGDILRISIQNRGENDVVSYDIYKLIK